LRARAVHPLAGVGLAEAEGPIDEGETDQHEDRQEERDAAQSEVEGGSHRRAGQERAEDTKVHPEAPQFGGADPVLRGAAVAVEEPEEGARRLDADVGRDAGKMRRR